MRSVLRHRRLVVLVVLAVAVAAALGAAAQSRSVRYAHPRGVACAFHGWRAWEQLRRGHHAWTAYHLWRATHTCGPAPWRY